MRFLAATAEPAITAGSNSLAPGCRAGPVGAVSSPLLAGRTRPAAAANPPRTGPDHQGAGPRHESELLVRACIPRPKRSPAAVRSQRHASVPPATASPPAQNSKTGSREGKPRKPQSRVCVRTETATPLKRSQSPFLHDRTISSPSAEPMTTQRHHRLRCRNPRCR